jgi:hypothetical protein
MIVSSQTAVPCRKETKKTENPWGQDAPKGSRSTKTPYFQGNYLVGRGHYPQDTAGQAAIEGEPHRLFQHNSTSALHPGQLE